MIEECCRLCGQRHASTACPPPYERVVGRVYHLAMMERANAEIASLRARVAAEQEAHATTRESERIQRLRAEASERNHEVADTMLSAALADCERRLAACASGFEQAVRERDAAREMAAEAEASAAARLADMAERLGLVEEMPDDASTAEVAQATIARLRRERDEALSGLTEAQRQRAWDEAGVTGLADQRNAAIRRAERAEAERDEARAAVAELRVTCMSRAVVSPGGAMTKCRLCGVHGWAGQWEHLSGCALVRPDVGAPLLAELRSLRAEVARLRSSGSHGDDPINEVCDDRGPRSWRS